MSRRARIALLATILALVVVVPALVGPVRERRTPAPRSGDEPTAAAVCPDALASDAAVDTDAGADAARVAQPVAATATSDDGNTPDNVLDGDVTTRWSARGSGERLYVDFGRRVELEALELTFYEGRSRRSSYDIAVADAVDGPLRTVVADRQSSGIGAVERVDLSGHAARFVVYIGHGNSENDWNSIVEVRHRPLVAPTASLPSPASDGLWISRSELMDLPTSGPAWDNVVDATQESWGEADLADRNSMHDAHVLAGALVGVRTGDDELIDQTRAGIMEVLDSDFDETLDLSRNLPAYVIAADIIDLRRRSPSDDAAFRRFLEDVRTRPMPGHTDRDSSLVEDALTSSNNWGTLARAAVIAVDLYLGTHPDELEAVARTSLAWLGGDVDSDLVWTTTRWHPEGQPRAGINPPGATIQGQDVSGVMPEEQRRHGESVPAEPGTYPWAGLQGVVLGQVLLDRAGILDFDACSDAIVRAMRWLFEVNDNSPPENGDWTPWVVNAYAATDFPTSQDSTFGRNMGWTAWTHATPSSEPTTAAADRARGG